MTLEESIALLRTSPNHHERMTAARALADAEQDYRLALPALVESLLDEGDDVRVAVISALISIWTRLHSPSGSLLSDVLPDAVDELFAPAIPTLQQLLEAPNNFVRLQAAEALRILYCADDQVLNVFLECARDADDRLRMLAARSLSQGASELRLVLSEAGPFLGGGRAPLHNIQNSSVITALSELSQDKVREVGEYALDAINSIGPGAKAAAPALRLALKDTDESFRFKAACALASVGIPDGDALTILAAALRDNDTRTRRSAAAALRSLGSEAKPVVTDLITALSDSEPRVRIRSAAALGAIGADAGDEAILALLEMARDTSSNLRNAAERALETIGKDLVDAVSRRAAGRKARDSFPLFGFQPEDLPGLVFMLRDPDANIRAYAATAIAKAGGDIQTAVPDLISLLDDEDQDVRARAARTLEALKTADSSGA
jgi:HEAT repeat protein